MILFTYIKENKNYKICKEQNKKMLRLNKIIKKYFIQIN